MKQMPERMSQIMKSLDMSLYIEMYPNDYAHWRSIRYAQNSIRACMKNQGIKVYTLIIDRILFISKHEDIIDALNPNGKGKGKIHARIDEFVKSDEVDTIYFGLRDAKYSSESSLYVIVNTYVKAKGYNLKVGRSAGFVYVTKMHKLKRGGNKTTRARCRQFWKDIENRLKTKETIEIPQEEYGEFYGSYHSFENSAIQHSKKMNFTVYTHGTTIYLKRGESK